MNIPKKIILHHSATDEGTFESIKRYHMNKGWNDIGYHWLIEKDGSLHQGRHESLVAAHTKGHNSTSIGICLVGNFDKYKPSDRQINSLILLIRGIFKRHGNLPIYPHSKYARKTCPGTKFPLKEVSDLSNQENFTVPVWAEEAWQWGIDNGLNDGIVQHEFEIQMMVLLYRYHQDFGK